MAPYSAPAGSRMMAVPAYIIKCTGLVRWTAERRDTHEVLRSDTAEALLIIIRVNYAERPVPRCARNRVTNGDNRPAGLR